MGTMNPNDPMLHLNELGLTCLGAEQIKRIDHALSDIGDFGEVRLIKAKGKLRFIQKVSSEEVRGNRYGSTE